MDWGLVASELFRLFMWGFLVLLFLGCVTGIDFVEVKIPFYWVLLTCLYISFIVSEFYKREPKSKV